MREELSSIDLAVVTTELNEYIRGSRINKIYQINSKTILLKLRRGSEIYNLLIEAGRRIHLTFYEVDKPEKPPVFCMALRKCLENGIIEDITQHDFERIIEVTVRSSGQKYRLIVELFERGNIILVGPDNKILHALTYRKMRDRNILRGEEFKYPPHIGLDPKIIDLKDLCRIRDLGQVEVVRGLTRLLGIGGFYAEEVLLRAGVDRNKQCSSLSDEEVKSIYYCVKEIMRTLESGDYKPCIIVDEYGNWVDVAPFPLKRYSEFKTLEVETYNKALDEYYMRAYCESDARQAEKKVEQEISNLERILEEQRRNLSDLREKASVYRRVGDIIYSHLYEVDSLINRVMKEKKTGRSWDEIIQTLLEEKSRGIVPSSYFVSLNPEELTLQVSIDGQSFSLNLKDSAQNNAAEYYEKAKKVENKIKGAEKAIEETIAKIEAAKIEAHERIEEATKPPKPIRRKEWYEKFRWFHSSEGFLVIGGRDATTNEIIIRKYTDEYDIVFHADIPGSPFVVVKTFGKQPGEDTIFEAAQFTASYSKAWKEHIGAVDVYWVKPAQISKAPPSGQYLTKGSFMIYGSKNYIRGVPLEIAIGIRKDGDEWKVIGGPINAILKQTRFYVKIIPGKTPSGKLAKSIRKLLADIMPISEREKVLGMPLEDIQLFIPLGRGDISGRNSQPVEDNGVSEKDSS